MKGTYFLSFISVVLIYTGCYKERMDKRPQAKWCYMFTVTRDPQTNEIDTVYLGNSEKPYSLTNYANGITVWKQGDTEVLRLRPTGHGTSSDVATTCIGEEHYRDYEGGYRLIFHTEGRTAIIFQIPWLDGNQKYNCYAYSVFEILYENEIIE